MNNVGENINMESAKCREFDVNELMMILKSDIMKFWSWGSRSYTVDKTKGTRMFRFRVSGYHHKGYVYIFLNGLDLFDVYLTNLKDKIKVRTDEMGIYVDELVDWIDEKVERIPEYKD